MFDHFCQHFSYIEGKSDVSLGSFKRSDFIFVCNTCRRFSALSVETVCYLLNFYMVCMRLHVVK